MGQSFCNGRDGTREQVIEKYERYLLDNDGLLSCLEELRGKVLVCFCKPNPCHGDILAKLLEQER